MAARPCAAPCGPPSWVPGGLGGAVCPAPSCARQAAATGPRAPPCAAAEEGDTHLHPGSAPQGQRTQTDF